MNDMLKKIMERRKFLENLNKDIKKELEYSPEGSLRISKSNGTTQYYYKNGHTPQCGKYIARKDNKLAFDLARKDYLEKVWCQGKKEIEAIDKLIRAYPEVTSEQVYENLSDDRRSIVDPIWIPDDIYLKNWIEAEYTGGEFSDDTEIYTAKGERVRSKSEVIIADFLNNENIPYKYERPVYLNGYGMVYPDFTLLDIKRRKEILWEHFGRMDDPDYAAKSVRKINLYNKNGYYPGTGLIITFETEYVPLNSSLLKNLLISAGIV